jgi:hypothetical protein
MRDFNQRQSELFVLVCGALSRYRAADWQNPTDDDVVEAVASLASTFETASRGIIYEHRAASATAERLALTLKPAIMEAGKGGGSVFERDAAVVLRRVGDVAADVRGSTGGPRAFLDLLERTIQKDADTAASTAAPQESTRLIVP